MVNVNKPKVASIDEELTNAYKQLNQIKDAVQSPLCLVQDRGSSAAVRDSAMGSLQELDEHCQTLELNAKTLVNQSLGSIPTCDFSQDPHLFKLCFISHLLQLSCSPSKV